MLGVSLLLAALLPALVVGTPLQGESQDALALRADSPPEQRADAPWAEEGHSLELEHMEEGDPGAVEPGEVALRAEDPGEVALRAGDPGEVALRAGEPSTVPSAPGVHGKGAEDRLGFFVPPVLLMEFGDQGDLGAALKPSERVEVGAINLGGLTSMFFFMAAPIVYPLLVGASERASNNPGLQRRREEATERLFGPINRMMSVLGGSIERSSDNLSENIKETRESMRAATSNLPQLIRKTAKSARTRNYRNLRRMGKATSALMNRISSTYRRARERNSQNLRRIGSVIGNVARTARSGYAKAARRMG